MNEKLLQYIWQFQYFNSNNLTTQSGQAIAVINTGAPNTNQGPDFLNAKIKIGTALWAGSVELHVKSSDWKNHKHDADSNYKNIILHVVWEDDEDLQLNFPVLELQHRVPGILLKKYNDWMQSPVFIPCEKNILQVNEFIRNAWYERLLIERLVEKSKAVLERFEESNHHWEAVFWWMLARNFGIKVNAGAFEKIARSVSLNVLAKHKNQIHQIEAVLLGQGGLLNGSFTDDYCILLQKEYQFLKKKYQLQPVQEPLHFLRMRPGNFPTVRLAQLAMIVHESSHLFSRILQCDTAKAAMKYLDRTANDYWHYHYVPDEPTAYQKKKPGKQMAENIVINTLAPVLFAYGHYLGENKYKEKALQWLRETGAEKNTITTGFAKIGIMGKTACDSQALLQLKNVYCNHKRCLECAIGNSILKKLPE